SKRSSKSSATRSAAAKPGAPMAESRPMSPVEADAGPAIDYESLRRSTQAQASAQTVAGQTRYELEERVTVPDGTSTMVAIVNADVQGEEAFLYRPGGAGMGYESNPYRVVRFENTTPFAL